MEALNNIKYVKNNWHKCSEWELAQADEDLRFEKLKANTNVSDSDIAYSKKRGERLVSAVRIMDQISINKSKNALVGIKTLAGMMVNVMGLLGFAAFYTAAKCNKIKTTNPKMTAFVGYSLFILLGACISNFLCAHFDKLATRIARYQTRNNELKDVRNFVTYTDAQIELAKKKADDIKEVHDVTVDMSAKESLNVFNVFKKSIDTIKKIKSDYKGYKNWRSDYAKKDAEFVKNTENIKMTDEESIQAQKDKNFILRTVKKLELATNAYEINLGFGLKTTGIILSLLTTSGGFLLSWGLGKLSQRPKMPSLVSNVANYASKLSIPAGILSLFLFAGPLVKFAKEVAQIGRFKEIERLRADEKNFYPYTDADIKNTEILPHDKAKSKTVFQKLKENYRVLFGILKDFNEYKTYSENKKIEQLKIEEALKTIPISQEQLTDAKRLQKQMFMAFEKIDDKSQSIVDDTTAFVASLSNLLICSACCFANIFTLKLFGKKIAQQTRNNKMPDFWEGIKLTRKLSLKNLVGIFILPYLITRCIVWGVSFAAAEIKKKACKIGIMSAMEDLNEPKRFVDKENQDSIFSDFHKKSLT